MFSPISLNRKTLSLNSSFSKNHDNISTMGKTSDFTVIQALISAKNIRHQKGIKYQKKKTLLLKRKSSLDTFYTTCLHQTFLSQIPKLKSSPSQIISTSNFSSVEYKLPSYFCRDISKELAKDIRAGKDFARRCKKVGILKYFAEERKKVTEKKESEIQNKFSSLEREVFGAKKRNHHLLDVTIPAYISYIRFLRTQLRHEENLKEELKLNNIKLRDEIELIKNKISKIKDRYKYYFGFRNFLVCVKEDVLELPKEFWEVDEKKICIAERAFSDKNIRDFKKRRTNAKKSTRIVSKNLKKLLTRVEEKASTDAPIKKYLDINKEIFSNPEEFIDKIKFKEARLIQLLKEDFKKRAELGELKELYNQLTQQFERDFKYEARKCKEDTEILHVQRKKDNLLQETLLAQQKALSTRNDRDLKKYIAKIPNDFPVKTSMMILKLNRIQKEKKFISENAYVYYYLHKFIFLFFRKCLKYFTFTEKSPKKEFIEDLDYIGYPDRANTVKIRKAALNTLKYYEIAVNNFLEEFRKSVTKNFEKYVQIINKRNRQSIVENFRNQRSMEEDKKEQRKNELLQKSKKILIKSRSYAFFNYRKKKRKVIFSVSKKNQNTLDYEMLRY